jgi:hypothetical protein
MGIYSELLYFYKCDHSAWHMIWTPSAYKLEVLLPDPINQSFQVPKVELILLDVSEFYIHM